MGILDWFKNRPAQFDPDRVSDEMIRAAADKAITLTNPRLNVLPGCQRRLAPAAGTAVEVLRAVDLIAAEDIGLGSHRAIYCMSFEFSAGLRRGQVRRFGFPRLFRFFQASRGGRVAKGVRRRAHSNLGDANRIRSAAN